MLVQQAEDHFGLLGVMRLIKEHPEVCRVFHYRDVCFVGCFFFHNVAIDSMNLFCILVYTYMYVCTYVW